MPLPRIFRIPRPKTFLHFISLRTGAELSILTLLINKVSGIYGILALFTGYHLSALQLSSYIYSIAILSLTAYLAPSLRSPKSPLQILALAWIFVLDSLVNIAYTTLFGLSWFVLLAQHLNDSDVFEGKLPVPGAKTMNDTAGFTDPENSVSGVDVKDGTLVARPGALQAAVFESGSLMSVSVISILWLVRIYFCVIVLSYARLILRHYIAGTSFRNPDVDGSHSSKEFAEDPFRVGREEGQGWSGKLGRVLVSFPRTYWLGRDDEEEGAWARSVGGKFGRSSRMAPGTGERERRARSGTGPPLMLSQPGGRGKSGSRSRERI